MATVAFIGLGNMGLPMAVNLVKSGATVTGYDLNPTSVRALQDAGGWLPLRHVEPLLGLRLLSPCFRRQTCS